MRKERGRKRARTPAFFAAAFTAAAILCGAAASETQPDLSTLVDKVSREAWPEGQSPSGTGFVITNKGHVFTASHVVAGCRKISVVLLSNPEHRIAATLIGTDSRIDAAVLFAPGLAGKALQFNENPPANGDALVIAGAQPETARLSASALGMGAESQIGRIFHYRAQLAPGMSGAPALDRHNLVAAVVVGRLDGRADVGIGITGQDLKEFLHYFGVPAPVHPPQGAIEVLGDWIGDSADQMDASQSIVKVSCR